MTGRREATVVVLVCVLCFLTGLGDLPFYTRGEPREALVVREMRETGHWLVPSRPEGEIARKPPLFYWLAASTVSLVPDRPELGMRLPSALLGTAGVLATWAAARRLVGPAAGLPAALVLATTFEWTRAAVSARVDMALAAPLALVALCWMGLLAGAPAPGAIGAAVVAAGLAALGKGPVALVLPALAAVAYAAVRRDVRAPFRLGLPAILVGGGAIAALWYLAAWATEGRAFLDVVLKENLGRFVDSEDAGTGHAHGLWYLPLFGLLGLLPWSPLLPLAIAPLRDRATRTAPLVMAATWCLVTLGFFSLADAKRSVYLLPIFPALAVLFAAGLEAPPRDGRLLAVLRAGSATYAPAFAVLAVAAAALALGIDLTAPVRPWLDPRDAAGAAVVERAAREAAGPFFLLAVATVLVVPVLARLRRAADWRGVVLAVAVLMACWIAAFDAFVHPAIGRARSLQGFMARLDRDLPHDATLHAFFPLDPGLRFYAPRPLVRWSQSDPAAPARHLLLWEDELARLRAPSGAPLAPLAVSVSPESGRGALALVVVPPGTLGQAPAPPPE